MPVQTGKILRIKSKSFSRKRFIMTVQTVTAREVREFFRSDAKRMEALSPEAQATVKDKARGLLHPEAVKVHNTRRRTRQYVPGASKAVAEARQADRARLREAGLLGEKARGPLSAAAKEFLAQPKG
jgi:hypothetical protein